MIARSVGIIAIALGFVIGMYGLDHPDSHWLQTALGLLVTGMVARGPRLCALLLSQTDAAGKLLTRSLSAHMNSLGAIGISAP